MAKRKNTPKAGAPKRRRKAPTPTIEPISYSPRHGLLVSTNARHPMGAQEKVTSAKSIVQAVIAAHDAEALEDENYDLSWPLIVAVRLLEDAVSLLDVRASHEDVSHGR